MKYLLFLLFSLLSIAGNSQILNLGDPDFKGNIISAVEKSKEYRNDWREFRFDSLSRLIEKKSYRDNNLVESIRWTYFENDSLLLVKELHDYGLFIHKSFYESNRRLIKYEVFSPKDSAIAFITELNVKYINGRIESFDRTIVNNSHTSNIVTYKYDYKYEPPNTIIHNNFNPETITLKYDNRGNLKTKIIDNNDSGTVISGARTWSHSRQDKFRIDYKYDQYGNWIKSYSVTRFCKREINEREIKYK